MQSLLPEKRELQEIINPEFSEIKYKQKRHSPARGTVQFHQFQKMQVRVEEVKFKSTQLMQGEN